MTLSHLKVAVDDLGLFPEVAVRIARDVAHVWYHSEWRDPFPEHFRAQVGDGLEGIERVREIEPYYDQADIIVMPDNTAGAKVKFLKDHGYAVAGTGLGERLELDRWYAKEAQQKSGLPTQDSWLIKGITELRKFLKEHKDVWIKLSTFRGLLESRQHIDYRQTESRLDWLAWKLGPYKEKILFVVEESLSGIEPGLDATMAGYEQKGVGIIERVYQTQEETPPVLLMLHEGLAPYFEKDDTNFFYSVEFKQDKDQVPWIIDLSMRMAAPGVSAIQLEGIENFTEVMQGLATGEKVDPVIKWKYAAALALEAHEAEQDWYNIIFPQEIRRWVKLRRAVKVGSDYYAVPGFDSVCTVTALGNTIDEVMKLVKERADQIQGAGLNKPIDELEKIRDSIEQGREQGIEF
jgi:hypothetical protein